MLKVDATCRITSHAHENVAASVTLSWVKPARNWLKCNVDCALFTIEGCFGVNICFRDNLGSFVQVRLMLFSPISHSYSYLHEFRTY